MNAIPDGSRNIAILCSACVLAFVMSACSEQTSSAGRDESPRVERDAPGVTSSSDIQVDEAANAAQRFEVFDGAELFVVGRLLNESTRLDGAGGMRHAVRIQYASESHEGFVGQIVSALRAQGYRVSPVEGTLNLRVASASGMPGNVTIEIGDGRLDDVDALGVRGIASFFWIE